MQLEQNWRRHPLGARRATGGRVAIGGFAFQLSTSLLRFVELAEAGDPSAAIVFEGLSDLALVDGPVLCLVQMKTTLDRSAARAVAHEALAIDEFLEQKHLEVRERVRFEVYCLRHKTVDPSALTAAELELAPTQQSRWEALRPRMLPPVVRGEPFSELVARLFPIAANAPDLAKALLGDLTHMLASDRSSSDISESLIERLALARERRIAERPGALLVAEDFARKPDGTEILLGQRPAVTHLARGWFMDRDDIATSVADSVLAALESEEEVEAGIEVHWLTGSSGVGKSVLLLQAMEHLVQDGRCYVHRIPHVPPSLRAALTYWRSGSESPIVVGIDDLYAPAHRDSAVWEEITAQALDADWSGRLVILTAGPDDYRKAFTDFANREGAFRVRPIQVAGLRPADRERYRAWHAARTGARTPPVHEPLFVVAALLAEAHRVRMGSVAEFAQRFGDRCAGLGLREPMMSALAMNRLGFPAPAALFADQLDQLDALIAENVIQRDDDAGEQLTVFHQMVASAVYEPLVHGQVARAQHLAEAFVAFPPGHEVRRGMLTLLHTKGSSAPLGRGGQQRVLAALWDPLWESEPADHKEVLAWLFGARARGISLDDQGRSRRLLEWMFASETPSGAMAPTWWVLRELCPGLRPELRERVIEWLRFNPTDEAWSELCCKVLPRIEDADVLLDLSTRWLSDHAGYDGWVELFCQVHPRRPLSLGVVVRGLTEAPVSPAHGGSDERRLWDAALAAGIKRKQVIALVTQRLCRSPSRGLVTRGVRYLQTIATPQDADAFSGAFMQAAQAPKLGLLVRVILGAKQRPVHFVYSARLAGTAWLENCLDAPDWAPTWIMVFTYSRFKQVRIKERLMAALERWLADNSSSRFWLPVMTVVFEDKPSAAAHHFAVWLPAHTSRHDWVKLWRQVRRELPDRGGAAAAAWLARHPAHASWFDVFAEIWDDVSDDDELRAAAMEWLESRPRALPWVAVFARLQARKVDEALRSACRPWLLIKVRHPGWWWVFREVVGESAVELALAQQARIWLKENPGSCGVPVVRAALNRGREGAPNAARDD